jgi:SAM-dependent methyltransferase
MRCLELVLHKLTPSGFQRPDGTETRVVRITGRQPVGAEWHRRQAEALPGYVDELDAVPDEVQRLYALFSCYVARALLDREGIAILDVGCGIGTRLPPYIRPLRDGLESRRMLYVGLDPIEINADKREYPFICGRLEDVPSALDARFAAFVFATSLDHLEDTAVAAGSVRALAAPRAVAIFWIGLHDPRIVAEELGRKWFGRLYASLNPLVFLLRAAQVGAVMLRRYPDMIRRAWKLRRGVPLDKLHFRYFTLSDVFDHLGRFGKLRDFTLVPGTNSAFATVEVSTEAAGA